MNKRKSIKLLSALMVLTMVLSLLPTAVFAQQSDQTEISTQTVDDSSADSVAAESGSVTETKTIVPAADYATFLASLKVLEKYASDYALSNNTNAVGLILNYIRTGISKYNTDSWATLAGAENTAFTSYVAAQDTANNTTAQALRGIGSFTAPNGQTMEFAHMFGAMSIAYYNSNATVSADFGGWAGDICDLMEYTNGKLKATDVEAMAQEIRTSYLGVDDENAHSFGYQDIYGDLDGYYFMSKLSGSTTLSSLMESYYTSSLTDTDRSVYFLTNRFTGKTTQADIREALFSAYKDNSGASLLETDRGLSADSDLRQACCYAFADYLYDLAKDKLAEKSNPYYTVFSSKDSTLAPGIEQNIKYALTADQKQIVYYTATIDIARDDVGVYANYKNNDGSSWGMSRVTDQMAAAKTNHSDSTNARYIENYTPVVGVNADFYDMTDGTPGGALVMEGTQYHDISDENFFAILKNGKAVIGGATEWDTYKGQIQEAVGGSIYLVKDGKIAVTATQNYYDSRAPRTCVGIKADGKVVLMALDGRQEPFSTGGSAEEIAQIMLEAGCVTAINLDGGGSTTFAAKEEGADSVSVVNRPSDGYERSVSSSLMVVSTAKSSNEFDHALVTADTDYLTVGASLKVSVMGVSASGSVADLPKGTELVVSDSKVASLADGVLTGLTNGTVTVSAVADGKTLGSKTLNVVQPDSLTFTKDKMNAVYGSSIALPIKVTYNGNAVTTCPADITFSLSTASAGAIDGFNFTGSEESGIREVTVTAVLKNNTSVSDTMQISLYKNGEAVFDFDTATSGDDSFAWNRDVTNSTTTDKTYYHVVDASQSMDISYIFALNITAVPIPDKLKPLLKLVAGGDTENIRAWDLLLQLAERVSTMTTVTVKLNIDPNLDIDYSGLTLVNDYFTLTGKTYDETNHTLTITCNWNKQTQAIAADTANPICILSGIKAVPKAAAQWDKNGCLPITNSGELSYDIYLRSSTLYDVANQTSTQETYGIYPFVNPNDSSETGGHFSTTYKTFSDSFTLDKSVWQGWRKAGDDLYYYVDNKVVTGVQHIPGYEDESNSYYYSFNSDGVCQGKLTGLFKMDGNLYYAINGIAATGWRMVTVDGKDNYYFFDRTTGKAVDGEQTIDGYNYIFTDCVLTHGALVKGTDGLHYKWAGEWIMNSWVLIDGKKYYAGKAPYGYFVTSMKTQLHKYGSNTEMGYCLFDVNGVWQENYSGLYTDEDNNVRLIKNGYLVEGAGLVYLDGYYYYFRSSTSAAVRSSTYWITVTNGLLPSARYTFDSDGKMIDPPVTPSEPTTKNGIVEENGSLYYYVNNVLTGAGLIKIDGNYYYVRTSNGEVVHGRKYWITATNSLLPSGEYTFADDGKMTDPPETPSEPETKNGIVEENGSLYYYVNNVLTGAGLIKIGSDYYYVRTSNGEVVHGRKYWITATNGLLPSKEYTFADDGKMAVS